MNESDSLFPDLSPPEKVWPCTVVHCKKHDDKDPHYVYVGRPSEWGNPFSHKENTIAQYRVASVEQALKAYEEWVKSSPGMLERIRSELSGKVLGCWCRPAKGFRGKYLCHAQFLASIANGCRPEEIP